MTSAIDTSKVTDRRHLRFASVAEALADVERLVEAERAGTLTRTGNWTLGQALGHVAFWARAPFDGYPDMPAPPWFVRWLIPLFKRRVLHRGLPAGFRFRNVEGGTFGTAPLMTDDSAAQVHSALERLAREAPAMPNPLFGPLTHHEWIALNLRHAELHLSFFRA